MVFLRCGLASPQEDARVAISTCLAEVPWPAIVLRLLRQRLPQPRAHSPEPTHTTPSLFFALPAQADITTDHRANITTIVKRVQVSSVWT